MILLPSHLAEAIEWVLRPTREAHAKPPDLSRLTGEQMQLLPLAVAHDLMELAIAAQQQPALRRKHVDPPRGAAFKPRNEAQSAAQVIYNPYIARAEPAPGYGLNKLDARSKQRSRRDRQRAELLSAAHERLFAWYIQTASAKHSGFGQQVTPRSS